MKIVELDGSKMDSIQNTHIHLKESMMLPEYYGENLDAMYDVMSDIRENTFVFVLNSQQMRTSLGDYGARMERVWEDLEQHNKHLSFFMR